MTSTGEAVNTGTTKRASLPRYLVPFSRETSSGHFVPEIDGLRFIAIAAVLFVHINGFVARKSHVSFRTPPSATWVGAVLEQGYVGVQLFFVISGMILGIPFARARLCGGAPVRLGKYLLRRVTRLEPPYLICLVCLSVLAALFKPVVPADFAKHLLASAFYLHGLIYHAPSTVNAVAWSLEVEVQFYLLAPIMALVFLIHSKRVRRGLMVCAMLLVGAAQRGPTLNVMHGLMLYHHLAYFIGGFLLADLSLTEWSSPSANKAAWDLAATAAFILVPLTMMKEIWPAVLVPLLIVVAFAGTFRGTLWKGFVSTPIVFTIGGMCYSIYLYHPLVKSFVGNHTLRLGLTHHYGWNVLLQFLLIAPPVVMVCAILFVLFEKPFMRRHWPKEVARFLRRGTGPSSRSEASVDFAATMPAGIERDTATSPTD